MTIGTGSWFIELNQPLRSYQYCKIFFVFLAIFQVEAVIKEYNFPLYLSKKYQYIFCMMLANWLLISYRKLIGKIFAYLSIFRYISTRKYVKIVAWPIDLPKFAHNWDIMVSLLYLLLPLLSSFSHSQVISFENINHACHGNYHRINKIYFFHENHLEGNLLWIHNKVFTFVYKWILVIIFL